MNSSARTVYDGCSLFTRSIVHTNSCEPMETEHVQPTHPPLRSCFLLLLSYVLAASPRCLMPSLPSMPWSDHAASRRALALLLAPFGCVPALSHHGHHNHYRSSSHRAILPGNDMHAAMDGGSHRLVRTVRRTRE